jgi:2'-5' RNA ligase
VTLRSAVVVPVGEAAAAVDGWRERTCFARPSIGIPAHVTLVFPFVPAAQVDDAVLASLRAILGGAERFGFELREPRRFPTALYLAPEPAQPFVRLTEAIVARFPGHPPYEGAFDAVVPHLTVAQGDACVLDEAEASLRALLPIACEAHEALLLEEVEANWGRWQVRARLPFGEACESVRGA